MARWPNVLSALALLAAPAALAAQPAEGHLVLGPPPEPVELATLVGAARTCREAPADVVQATRHVRSQGWQPGDDGLFAARPTPGTPMFWRDQVLLALVPPAGGFPGACFVMAWLRGPPPWADVEAAFSADFHREPISWAPAGASWRLDDRTVDGSSDSGLATITFSPEPPSRRTRSSRRRPRPATPAAPVSPAGDIAAAAADCVAAVGGSEVDRASLERAGWTIARERYSRPGSNVAILVIEGRCVVEAHGERRDSFSAIRQAISARLTERFGVDAIMGEPPGSPVVETFPRGQRFTVGSRTAYLWPEQSDDGLGIHFTVMSLNHGSAPQ
jgi:hypothetical protein